MFVGEVFNGMVGYLSFCLRLLKVDQEAFPTKVSPQNIPAQNQGQFAGGGQWYDA